MGKPAGRLGDIGSAHGAWHPSPVIAGSGDVFTNGRPAARQGDAVAPHVKPKSPPHGRSIAAGASQVFINGKPAARVGDAISCGGNVSTGSGDVFIGDSPTINKPHVPTLPDIVFPSQRGNTRTPAAARQQQPPYRQHVMDAEPAVTLPESQMPAESMEPEFKSASVRLDISPKQASMNDTFTLTATDGSYSATKKVSDDLIPGDNYLDLQFDDMDTSKRYTLTHTHEQTGQEYIYFDDIPYSSI